MATYSRDENEHSTPNGCEPGVTTNRRCKDITNTYSVNQLNAKTVLHKEDTFVDNDPKSVYLRANMRIYTFCVKLCCSVPQCTTKKRGPKAVKDKMTNTEKWLFFKEFGFVYIHNDIKKAKLVQRAVKFPHGIKARDVKYLVQTTLCSLIEGLFQFNREDFHSGTPLGVVSRTRANKFLNGCMEVLYGQGMSIDTWCVNLYQ